MKIAGDFGEILVTDHIPANIMVFPHSIKRLDINEGEEITLSHRSSISCDMRFLRPFPQPDGIPYWKYVWTGYSCLVTDELVSIPRLIFEILHIPLSFTVRNNRWSIDESAFDRGEYYHWEKCSM